MSCLKPVPFVAGLSPAKTFFGGISLRVSDGPFRDVCRHPLVFWEVLGFTEVLAQVDDTFDPALANHIRLQVST
jgi:hypothetical protein